MRVLLVEASGKTGREIASMLNLQSFNLHHAHLGEEALDLATLYDYSIIVLDFDLPDMDGHEVLRTLRTKGIKTPIIIVSKTYDVEKRVESFNLGADDHLVKPIHQDEMIARIYAIIRRSLGQAENNIKAGSLVLNIDSKIVQVGGKNIHLTKKQYLLLETLLLNRDKVVTREKLLNNLYHDDEGADYRTIDVMVGRIRRKIVEDLIQTIRGYGYMFRVIEE